MCFLWVCRGVCWLRVGGIVLLIRLFYEFELT